MEDNEYLSQESTTCQLTLTEFHEEIHNRFATEQCVLKSQEKEFLVDKNVLCSKSIYFKTMFESEMKESLSNRVVLNEISSPALEIILKFIETEILEEELDRDLLVELTTSSHMLMLDGLHEECCKRIEITEVNYSTIVALNDIYQNLSLRRNLAMFQGKHFKTMNEKLLHLSCDDLEFLLSNSTIEATVDDVIDFLLSWCKTKKENILNLPRLFTLVNMASITEESFDRYLSEEPIIRDNSEVYEAFIDSAAKGIFRATKVTLGSNTCIVG